MTYAWLTKPEMIMTKSKQCRSRRAVTQTRLVSRPSRSYLALAEFVKVSRKGLNVSQMLTSS